LGHRFSAHRGSNGPQYRPSPYHRGRKYDHHATRRKSFLDRSDRTFRRKIQEMLLALQIERRYTKPQIFTMYANQVYLAHGNYGFAAAAQFYFGKSVTDLNLQEAALLAGMVNGPKFSPIANPEAALNRRNLVLRRMEEEGKISAAEASNAKKAPLGLHIQFPRQRPRALFLLKTSGNTSKHLRHGSRPRTWASRVHNAQCENATRREPGGPRWPHSYDRRHGWRGGLPNLIKDNLGKLETYEDEDWRHPIEKGSYVTGLARRRRR